MAHHPLTGQSLPEPSPLPLKTMALYPEEREKPCTNHQIAYTGRIPCTGNLRCFMCLTQWNPNTCEVLKPERLMVR